MATTTRALDVTSLDAPISPAEPPTSMEEVFTINFGPHHPATHGVLRLLVQLEGEIVREAGGEDS